MTYVVLAFAVSMTHITTISFHLCVCVCVEWMIFYYSFAAASCSRVFVVFVAVRIVVCMRWDSNVYIYDFIEFEWTCYMNADPVPFHKFASIRHYIFWLTKDGQRNSTKIPCYCVSWMSIGRRNFTCFFLFIFDISQCFGFRHVRNYVHEMCPQFHISSTSQIRST